MPIITVYRRRFAVKGAPTAASLVPYPQNQKHTFTVGTDVYEATFHQSFVEVPKDATIDELKNLLCWADSKGKIKSTAAEVLGFAKAGLSGFRTASRREVMQSVAAGSFSPTDGQE